MLSWTIAYLYGVLTMTNRKPMYRSLLKKPSELPPTPTPAPAPTSTPPTQSSQSEIGLEGIDEHVDEYIDSSVTATKPLGKSGWDVAALLKEWRLDDFT
jgi:hypothetical protein